MVREWRSIPGLILRSDVVMKLEEKYAPKKIKDIIEELVYQEVCVRAMNHCSACGKEIYIWLLKTKFHEAGKWEAVKDALCSVCKPGSQWEQF